MTETSGSKGGGVKQSLMNAEAMQSQACWEVYSKEPEVGPRLMCMAKRLRVCGGKKLTEKSFAAAAAVARNKDGVVDADTAWEHTRSLKHFFNMIDASKYMAGPDEYPDSIEQLKRDHPYLGDQIQQDGPTAPSKLDEAIVAIVKGSQPCRNTRTGSAQDLKRMMSDVGVRDNFLPKGLQDLFHQARRQATPARHGGCHITFTTRAGIPLQRPIASPQLSIPMLALEHYTEQQRQTDRQHQAEIKKEPDVNHSSKHDVSQEEARCEPQQHTAADQTQRALGHQRTTSSESPHKVLEFVEKLQAKVEELPKQRTKKERASAQVLDLGFSDIGTSHSRTSLELASDRPPAPELDLKRRCNCPWGCINEADESHEYRGRCCFCLGCNGPGEMCGCECVGCFPEDDALAAGVSPYRQPSPASVWRMQLVQPLYGETSLPMPNH